MALSLYKSTLCADSWPCFAGRSKLELVNYGHSEKLDTQRLFPAKLGLTFRISPPCWEIAQWNSTISRDASLISNLTCLGRSEAPLSIPSAFIGCPVASCLPRAWLTINAWKQQIFYNHSPLMDTLIVLESQLANMNLSSGEEAYARQPASPPWSQSLHLRGGLEQHFPSPDNYMSPLLEGRGSWPWNLVMTPALCQQQAALICFAA